MKIANIISWALRITIAAIYMQTLYFKFTAHPDSVYIFTKLGVEPYGRIGLGIAELITSILILFPGTKIAGLFASFGIICGALVSHFMVIGTEVKGDGGGLLALAFVVFLACIGLFIMSGNEIKNLIVKFTK